MPMKVNFMATRLNQLWLDTMPFTRPDANNPSINLAVDQVATPDQPPCSKVFSTDNGPSLACEQPGSWKVPLVSTDKEPYYGMHFHIKKRDYDNVRKDFTGNQYILRILPVIMGVNGVEYLKEERIRARDKGEEAGPKRLLTSGFFDALQGIRTVTL